jgi:hypothetical protein
MFIDRLWRGGMDTKLGLLGLNMNKTLLRLKPKDALNDIWQLQERRYFLFIPYWKTLMTGRKKWCDNVLGELDRQGLLKLVDGVIEGSENQIERLK